MFCIKCGTQLSDNAGFCHKCGKSVNPGTSATNSTKVPTQNKPQQLFQHIKSIPTIWKIIGGIVLSTVCICFIVYGVNKALNDTYDYSPNNYSGDRSNNNTTDTKFAWVEEPSIKANYSYGVFVNQNIVGTIKNISGKTYSYVSIEFNLYDSSGNQIDTAIDFISNFKSGNTWKFEAGIWNDKVSSYEFEGITYY